MNTRGRFEWTPQHNNNTTAQTQTHRKHAHAGHTRTHAQKTRLHKVTFSKCPCRSTRAGEKTEKEKHFSNNLSSSFYLIASNLEFPSFGWCCLPPLSHWVVLLWVVLLSHLSSVWCCFPLWGVLPSSPSLAAASRLHPLPFGWGCFGWWFVVTPRNICLAPVLFLPWFVILMEARQGVVLSRVICHISDVWASLHVLIVFTHESCAAPEDAQEKCVAYVATSSGIDPVSGETAEANSASVSCVTLKDAPRRSDASCVLGCSKTVPWTLSEKL